MNNLYDAVKAPGTSCENIRLFSTKDDFPATVDSLFFFPIPHGHTLVEALHDVRPVQPFKKESENG